MAPEPAAKKPPRRRGKRGVTRARLIDATIELLRREDIAALTTARVAREAGIAQPGFYAHFDNLDACVREAISQVVSALQERQAAARRRVFERAQAAQDPLSLELVRAAYVDTIEVALEEPRFAELFLRYRRDPALLGGYLREVMDAVRDELTADLWRIARRRGLRPESYPRVAFYAEAVLALYMAAVEALLDGRFSDRNLVYDALALYTRAMLTARMPA